MNEKKKKEILNENIKRLEQIKEVLYNLEEEVVAIEKNVCAIDESSRDDKEIYRLCDRAYAIIDELLGPPDEEQEAPKTINLGDAMKKFS